MGFLDKLKQFAGGADTQLLTTGLPGRAVILEVTLSGMTVEVGNAPIERTCIFTVEVSLDNTAPYRAQVRQRIPEFQLGQIQPGQSVVAVRVDPANPQHVAIDFGAEPPNVVVATQAGQSTAADVLANGEPCEVVIVQTQPLGMRNQAGTDLHAFLLSVFVAGRPPYQAKVGNPVPPAAVPLLFPGSRLPAKVEAGDPNGIAIDWDAALAAT